MMITTAECSGREIGKENGTGIEKKIATGKEVGREVEIEIAAENQKGTGTGTAAESRTGAGTEIVAEIETEVKIETETAIETGTERGLSQRREIPPVTETRRGGGTRQEPETEMTNTSLHGGSTATENMRTLTQNQPEVPASTRRANEGKRARMKRLRPRQLQMRKPGTRS